jgi:hypothetical protein
MFVSPATRIEIGMEGVNAMTGEKDRPQLKRGAARRDSTWMSSSQPAPAPKSWSPIPFGSPRERPLDP